ncbi:MAG: helix-turn-helix domain-containing protein [Bacteroidales bacterium]|nr:helix-turn-helix domain-containing protein [Bacteroidales bacterium]
MYNEQTLQGLTFLMLYGGVGVLVVVAALYLLLRQANAIAPGVNPPRALRRWTAAFLLAAAMSHVWWYVFGVYWLTDDRLVRNITTIMLDNATLVPLVMAVLLSMLQDRRRLLWPWLLAMAPVVAFAVVGIVRRDWLFGYRLPHYWQLAVIVVFVVYYVFQLRQYSRWLLDNFADLEHKEVWRSLTFVIALLIVYELYTSNAGDIAREYLAQVLTVAIVIFLVWRVETLQRLDASVAVPKPQKEDYNYIGALLEERCAATGLYLQPDLTLAQLALALGTNRTYLGAYFAQAGITYNAYINRLRVEHFERLHAKAVAVSRPVTASQLAQESGFRNYNTFSTAFKSLRGINVSVWMKGEAEKAKEDKEMKSNT